ncbi:MAG: MBL fold metallo-hydrolase [Gammaproteobacteria bacterium]
MSRARIRFWGVRGSYAAPFASHLNVGGNTSCVEIRAGDHLLVCDGGTGIIPLGEELIRSTVRHDLLIVFTHYHWDHICGMPFFVPAFQRDWNIKFFGPGESAKDIENKLAAQMKAPYFPVETETWAANISYLSPRKGGLKHGPMQIQYHNVHHPGVTYGYRVAIDGKSIVYVSDNEFLFLAKSIAQRQEEFDAADHEVMMRVNEEERAAELKFIAGADILIHDAQYTPRDYDRKRGWGHSCYIDTVNSAIDAGVRKLYLYHHDPSYNDDQIRAIHAHAEEIVRDRGASLECEIACEGMVVEV